MNCAYCDFRFKILAANSAVIPDRVPVLCEFCGEISLLESGILRKVTPEELAEIKKSPAWTSYLGPAQELIRKGVKVQ